MRKKCLYVCRRFVHEETMQATNNTILHIVLAIVWTRQDALVVYINASHVTICKHSNENALLRIHVAITLNVIDASH